MKATRFALSMLAALSLTQPARAFWNDRFIVFGDETATYDSNVFRLSREIDPAATTGSSSRSDRFTVTSVGSTLDVPYSLQRFQAGYTWFAQRYQRFDQLDFNGHYARANWLWALSPHVTGDIGVSDSKTLANFALFQGTTRDLLSSREAHANGTIELTPSWLLYGGLEHAEREHSDPLRRLNDVKTDAEEVRFSYVAASQNRVGVSLRHDEGKTPGDGLLNGVPFRNDYKQNGIGLVGAWTLSGVTRLEGRADYVHRTYQQLSDRDYSGPSLRLWSIWTPTGKTTITTTLFREIAPLDDVQTAFVLETGIAIRPRWEATSKVTVEGNFQYAKWDYRNAIGTQVVGATSFVGDYQHRVRTGGVSVAWRPFTRVLVQAGVLREVRTSSLRLADYTDNVFSLEARIGF